MSDKNKYPARGEMSADKQFYTHTDGKVHKFTPYPAGYFDDDPNRSPCDSCSMNTSGFCQGTDDLCSCAGGYFEFVSGAYVPTESEAAITEACEMARGAVNKCCLYRWVATPVNESANACASCAAHINKNCPARVYLAKHGQADAWAADMEGNG